MNTEWIWIIDLIRMRGKPFYFCGYNKTLWRNNKFAMGISECMVPSLIAAKNIFVVKLIIYGSDNGLSPGRCQAIIWTSAEILSIESLGKNFSEILIGF